MNGPVMVCKLRMNGVAKQHKTEAIPAEELVPGQPHWRTLDQWDYATIVFGAVYESDKSKNPENELFGSMTPYAEFRANVFNKCAVERLVPGKSYYVTFTEAPD